MKIKKKTSLMMLAASTAAVVGVAAVSFAAWNGGTPTLTASAATGNVDIIGFTTESKDAADNANANLPALFPCDQQNVTSEMGTTCLTIMVPAFEYTEDVQLNIMYGVADGYESVATLDMKYVWDSNVTCNNAPATEEAYATWGTALTQTSAKIGDTFAIGNDTVKTQNASYVHIVLKSSNSSDMEQHFKVTVSLTAATANA